MSRQPKYRPVGEYDPVRIQSENREDLVKRRARLQTRLDELRRTPASSRTDRDAAAFLAGQEPSAEPAEIESLPQRIEALSRAIEIQSQAVLRATEAARLAELEVRMPAWRAIVGQLDAAVEQVRSLLDSESRLAAEMQRDGIVLPAALTELSRDDIRPALEQFLGRLRFLAGR